MNVKSSVVLGVIAGSLISTGAARAGSTPDPSGEPRFWVWDPNLHKNYTFGPRPDFSSEIGDDRIIHVVWTRADVDSDPETIADLINGEILSRSSELDADHKIGVLLQDWGNEVMLHEGDVLDDTYDCNHCDGIDPCVNGDWEILSPWSAGGVAALKTWTEAFRDHWLDNDYDDDPSPVRFIFDSEDEISIMKGHGKEDGARIYQDYVQTDSRFSNEILPGFDNASLDTLSELEADAGIVTTYLDRCADVFDEDNVEWASWYRGILVQAFDGAMKESTYDVFAQTNTSMGAEVLSSNWWTSCLFDGGTGPEGLERVWRRNSGWDPIVSKGSGGLQAPVLYGARAEELLIGEDELEGCLRLFSDKLDVSRYSFTTQANPNDNITPWIPLVNRPVGDAPSNVLDGDLDDDMMRDMLHLCRSKDVDEFLVWTKHGGGGNGEPVVDWAYDIDAMTPTLTDNWDRMSLLIDQVWGSDFYTAPVVVSLGTETSTGDDGELLGLSDYYYYTVDPELDDRLTSIIPLDPEDPDPQEQSADTYIAEMLIMFELDDASIAEDRLRLAMNVRTLTDEAVLTVEFFNWTLTQYDSPVVEMDIDETRRHTIRADVEDGEDYVSSSGNYVLARVRFESYDETASGNTASIDYISVIAADDYTP